MKREQVPMTWKDLYVFRKKSWTRLLKAIACTCVTHSEQHQSFQHYSWSLQFFRTKLASRYPTDYFKVNDDTNHKAYFHDCQHVLLEVVSTRKFPLCCNTCTILLLLLEKNKIILVNHKIIKKFNFQLYTWQTIARSQPYINHNIFNRH